jgi:CheY-like chemotaxis protein
MTIGAQPRDAHQSAKMEKQMSESNTPTVMLVDDEEMVTTALGSFLELETPYRILPFNSPRAALQAIDSHSVEVVVADFMMPEMDGVDFLKAVRDKRPHSTLLRDDMPQVAVREASRGIAACVEFRGAVRLTGGCNHMAIFVDGVYMSAPGTIYPNIPLSDVERVEALSPGQAGVQYGTLGGNGVLLIETRTGTRPDREDQAQSTLVVGFDWSQEPTPYRWTHAVGGSLVANSLALGLGLSAVRSCYDVEDQSVALADDCGGFKAFASGAIGILLPVFATTLTTRWGGSTERSRGQVLPSLLLGAASASTGYLMIVQGQDVAAAVILGLGVPALGVFSDRLFRVLR